MLLLGAGALALVVVAFVLLRGGGASPPIERGDGSAFPLRGSLADDQGAVDDALKAWKDGRGAAADGRAGRVDDHLTIHLLYAGKIGERSIVVVRQGERLIGMRQALDRGWSVGDVKEGFDPFDGAPVVIDGSVLLPAGGDWTYLPLRGGGRRPAGEHGVLTGR